MMIGKGMLKQRALEAFMAWLPSDHITLDKEQTCLKVACQLFTRSGLPDPKILTDIEATLRRYIPEEMISDGNESSDSEDEPQEMVQIKALTLFCAAPEKWRTNIADIEQFLDAHNTAHHGQTVFRTTLDSLLRILANHGQAGFQFWLKYYSDNPRRKHALTRALLLSAPLAHTKYAFTQFSESEWTEYLELCKNLTPVPNKEQGNRLKPAAWSSLERYAKNGQLSDTLCRLLAPIIEKELASTAPDAIPEIVKKTVAERLRQTGTSQTAAVATATQLSSPTSTFAATPSPYASPLMSPSQILPPTQDIAIDMALENMARDMAIEELEHFPVLGRAELDILEPLRDQMTYSQLMDVITKINLQSVEQETVTAWQQTFENRRRDNLGLDLDEFLDSLLEGAVEV